MSLLNHELILWGILGDHGSYGIMKMEYQDIIWYSARLRNKPLSRDFSFVGRRIRHAGEEKTPANPRDETIITRTAPSVVLIMYWYIQYLRFLGYSISLVICSCNCIPCTSSTSCVWFDNFTPTKPYSSLPDQPRTRLSALMDHVQIKSFTKRHSSQKKKFASISSCWWFRNPANQLRQLAVYPILYKVLAPSQVVSRIYSITVPLLKIQVTFLFHPKKLVTQIGHRRPPSTSWHLALQPTIKGHPDAWGPRSNVRVGPMVWKLCSTLGFLGITYPEIPTW